MKVLCAAIFTAIVAVAQAQSADNLTSQIPPCALTCLSTASAGAGCEFSDHTCQCGSARPMIAMSARPCILKNCTTADALTTQSLAQRICDAVGSGSSSAGSTATSSEIRSSSTVFSIASSVSSAISSASSSMASSASSKASSVASSTVASLTTSSAAAQTTSNAASRGQAMGVVGGAALLAAFAL